MLRSASARLRLVYTIQPALPRTKPAQILKETLLKFALTRYPQHLPNLMNTEEISDCIDQLCRFPNTYKLGTLSPLAVMTQSGYPTLYSQITLEKITQYLHSKPDLVQDWMNYSDDIRCNPAWGFGIIDNKYVVAFYKNGKPLQEFRYDDKFAACAKMILETFESIRT